MISRNRPRSTGPRHWRPGGAFPQVPNLGFDCRHRSGRPGRAPIAASWHFRAHGGTRRTFVRRGTPAGASDRTCRAGRGRRIRSSRNGLPAQFTPMAQVGRWPIRSLHPWATARRSCRRKIVGQIVFPDVVQAETKYCPSAVDPSAREFAVCVAAPKSQTIRRDSGWLFGALLLASGANAIEYGRIQIHGPIIMGCSGLAARRRSGIKLAQIAQFGRVREFSRESGRRTG